MKQFKACTKCGQIKHLDDFYKSGRGGHGYQSACKECYKAQGKSWYQDNKEKKIASSKAYKASDREKSRAIGARHSKKYPERTNNRNQIRRARLHGVFIGYISNKELKRIYSRPCFYCGSTNNPTMDHIIPFELKGSHSIGNIVTACKSCNSSKSARFVMEWVALIPSAFPLRK